MTNLNELLEQGLGIKRDFQTHLATELTAKMAEEMTKLGATSEHRNGNAILRRELENKLREKYAREVMQIVADKQKEYKTIAEKAIPLAKQTKVNALKKPNDVDFAIFEREYNDLKIATQLSKPEAAVDAVSAFVSKYSDQDVFYADYIAQNFGDFTSIQADGNAKIKLAHTYDLVKHKAVTDEIATANRVLEVFNDADNVEIVSKIKPAFKRIKASIGPIGAHVNTPEKAIGILDGTIKTLGDMHGADVVE